MDLFKEAIPSLTNSKDYLLESEDLETEYGKNMFMVNRTFSFSPETIFYANEMNICPDIGAKYHYDFYYHIIPKKKVYSKWAKAVKSEYLESVKKFYGCSTEKAQEYLKLLTNDQLIIIQKYDKMTE